jgi:two-component system nitrate/nitrite response regulator NarL
MSEQQPDQAPQRVLIIDDHPLFRKGVADLLSLEPELQLVGEAASGEEGIPLAQRLAPDLILLDLNMRAMDGVETLRRLREAGMTDARILILTVSNADEDVVRSRRAGAYGDLLKDMEPEEILASLRTAMRGGVAISPELTTLLARALREDGSPVEPERAGLTRREREILNLLAAGMSNKLIARELDVAVGTVKVHVKNLLRKLGLKTRLEAAIWASKPH